MEERTCKKCNESKSIEEFPLNGDGKGGHRWQCKECMRNINRKWRSENKDKVSAYNTDRKNKGNE